MVSIFATISRVIEQTITVFSNKKLQFRDTGVYIQSSSDGVLKLSADGSGVDDITLSGATKIDPGLHIAATAYIATGTIASDASFVTLNPSVATGSAMVMQMGTPAVGRLVILSSLMTGSNVGTATVGLTGGCTFDGTNGTAKFTANNQTLVLFAVSATRFVVVENIGTVSFA